MLNKQRVRFGEDMVISHRYSKQFSAIPQAGDASVGDQSGRLGIMTGWWLTYPSEKYDESAVGKDYPI